MTLMATTCRVRFHDVDHDQHFMLELVGPPRHFALQTLQYGMSNRAIPDNVLAATVLAVAEEFGGAELVREYMNKHEQT